MFLITDVCSHKIMGYCPAQSLDGANALKALRTAMAASRHALKGHIRHSDRGSQYYYAKYVNCLRDKGPALGGDRNQRPVRKCDR